MHTNLEGGCDRFRWTSEAGQEILKYFGAMTTERRSLRPSDAIYAFVPTIDDAHAVARHVVLSSPHGTPVGFNRSSRGEGYVMIDPSVDISPVIREITGVDPIRVVTWEEIMSEPDGFGVPQSSEFPQS
jgi:hypothetical protein